MIALAFSMMLTTAAPPVESVDADALVQWLNALNGRDATAREDAVRRLLPQRNVAAGPVADLLASASLGGKLAALELLRGWRAPVAGLDPWRPDTLTPERLRAIRDWAAHPAETVEVAPTPDDLAAARLEINRLLAAAPAEVAVLRDRLARFRAALLPEVASRLRQPTTDRDRQRLTTLRYRLVADDDRVRNWPDGVDRLASADPAERLAAARELARRPSAADAPLLLELFANPDAMIREVALRSLYAASGKEAGEHLLKLLDDPEPNVRAAVLKQLAEKPSPAWVAKLGAYVERETDPDLIGHAARALRAAASRSAVAALVKLSEHPSWRVRAEAVQGLAECGFRSNDGQGDDTALAALIERLTDDDDFVIGRALKALQGHSGPSANKHLLALIDRRPDFARDAIWGLDINDETAAVIGPAVRQLANHPRPAARAAALACLQRYAGAEALDVLREGLRDRDGKVRLTAFQSLYRLVEEMRREPFSDELRHPSRRLRADQRGALVADLEPLLAAPDPAERLEAGLTLIAAERPVPARAVMTAVVRVQRDLLSAASAALQYLPKGDHATLFHDLLVLNPDAEERGDMARALDCRSERDSTALLWELAESEPMSRSLANTLVSGLGIDLYGAGYATRNGATRDINLQRATDTVGGLCEKVSSGSRHQRMIALELIRKTDLRRAVDAANAIIDNPVTPDSLRRDAYQFRLFAQPEAAMSAQAITDLRNTDPSIRRTALTALACGHCELQLLKESGIELEMNFLQFDKNIGPARPWYPEPSPGLTLEHIQSYRNDVDPEIAALAAYLATLLGDATDFTRLERHWRERGPREAKWSRLLCRAVVARGDDAGVALLDEMAALLPIGHFHVDELYWTMRGLDGPNALRLRRDLRQRHGMNGLGRPQPTSRRY